MRFLPDHCSMLVHCLGNAHTCNEHAPAPAGLRCSLQASLPTNCQRRASWISETQHPIPCCLWHFCLAFVQHGSNVSSYLPSASVKSAGSAGRAAGRKAGKKLCLKSYALGRGLRTEMVRRWSSCRYCRQAATYCRPASRASIQLFQT